MRHRFVRITCSRILDEPDPRTDRLGIRYAMPYTTVSIRRTRSRHPACQSLRRPHWALVGPRYPPRLAHGRHPLLHHVAPPRIAFSANPRALAYLVRPALVRQHFSAPTILPESRLARLAHGTSGGRHRNVGKSPPRLLHGGYCGRTIRKLRYVEM